MKDWVPALYVLSVGMLGLCGAPPSQAEQTRAAVSQSLSPADAGDAFERAVIEVCVGAVGAGRSVSSLSQSAMLTESDDPQTRQQAGAEADETVWDVDAGRGVVTLREKAGRCAVSVYGPPAAPTMILLAGKLAGEGFERMAMAGPSGMSQSLRREAGGRPVQVILTGSDPGAPGHSSRFSVVTATVFEMGQR